MARIRRLLERPRSIRTTLLTWLLPAALVFMAVAWLVHGVLLERMSRSFVEDRLVHEVEFLERQLRKSMGKGQLAIAAGGYFEEVFHHAFAIRVGEEVTLSPDTWTDALAPLLDSRQSGFVDQQVAGTPQAGPAHFLAYRKVVDIDGKPAVVLVAEDLTALFHGQRELHIWTAVVFLGLLALLGAVILLAVTLALRSARKMQHELQELQHGTRTRLGDDAPEEFRPLTIQLNRLLDTLDLRLERSRQAVANLSHSVKTPITAVKQLLLDQGRPMDQAVRLQMAERLSDINRQLEAEMRRSRFAGPQVGKAASPVRQARDLLWMLGRLYPDKQFELESPLDDDRHWPIEEHDLNEIIGNLLDNAGKWAGSRALVSLAENQGELMIRVSDNGPGVAPGMLTSLGTRGLRLDELTPGHGLGLAIVRDIVGRYGGTLAFDLNENGGLEALVRIPAGG